MKIELINENQLQIYLEQDDIINFELTHDTLDYNNEKARNFFWEMMKIAKEQNGFDAFHSRLILEMQKNDSGLLMTVTRDHKKGNYFHIKNSLSVKKHSKVSSSIISNTSFIHIHTFHFENFEDLILCCSKIKDLNNTLYNTLYYWDNSYYLSIAAVLFSNKVHTSSLLHMLNEYGKPIDEVRFDTFLKEHAKEIISFGAIENIQKYFKISH